MRNESHFERLLQRYLSGDASPEEQKRLNAWLDLDKTSAGREDGLSQEREEEILDAILRGSTEKRIPVVIHTPSKYRSYGWKAAAIILFCLGSLAIWQLTGRKSPEPVVIQSASEGKLILPDRSLVWLGQHSRLEYTGNDTDTLRRAVFQGEALFEIAKDASRPFVIECGDLKLRVLGTSFHIKASEGVLELKVLTGRVALSSDRSPLQLEVAANEKLSVGINDSFWKSSLAPEDKAKVTAGLEYNMLFLDNTLAEVASALGAKFDLIIQIKPQGLGTCRLTIDLTDMSLESSLQMISEILNVTYTVHSDHISFSGQACR